MAQPASLLLFAAAILSGVLAAAAGLAPKRDSAPVRFLFLANISILLWTATYFVQVSWGHYADPALAPAGSPDYLLLLVLVTGICLSATYWFLFSASLSLRAVAWTRRPLVWVAHLPAVYTLIVAALNPFTHLFIRQTARGAQAGVLAVPHYVSVLALVVAGIVVILTPGTPWATTLDRRQRALVALAACAPLAGSLLWVFRRFAGLDTLPFNPTPALFTLVGCVLVYEVLYRGFGNIVPLATLSSIVEHSESHLAYLDPDFRFVSANEAFRRRSLRTENELVGSAYFDVMPDEGRRRLFEAARGTLEPVMRSDDAGVFPRAADEAPSRWRWSLTPVGAARELRGFVLSLADVTREAQERELSRTLAELDVRIQRGFASDRALWDVVRQSGEALEADVMLVTHGGDRGLQVRDSRSPHTVEPYDAQLYPHLAEALFDGTTVVIEDALTDPRFSRGALQSLAIRSALVVPLSVDSGVAGALSFQRTLTRNGFTSAQVDFAERFAASVALSLHNAQRYEDERHIAQTLQESMLRITFDVPGIDFSHTYRSATEAARVGGDFYDLFGTDDGRIAMLIGDVAGHGIEAAVLTSLIKNAVRSSAIQHSSPASILAAVSEVMWRQTEPGMFASAFLGLLDPAEGTLTYCSAGHPPAIVLATDGTVSELPQHSIVLGLGPGSTFTDAHARIEPGQLLLLYTDGLTEARRGREFFGSERLAAELTRLAHHPAEVVVRDLYECVASFSSGRFADDVAVVAVRLLDAAESRRKACTG